eukprot:09710_3
MQPLRPSMRQVSVSLLLLMRVEYVSVFLVQNVSLEQKNGLATVLSHGHRPAHRHAPYDCSCCLLIKTVSVSGLLLIKADYTPVFQLQHVYAECDAERFALYRRQSIYHVLQILLRLSHFLGCAFEFAYLRLHDIHPLREPWFCHLETFAPTSFPHNWIYRKYLKLSYPKF